MPYLGRQGQFGIRERFQYLAGAGDTSVSGADANGITMTFSDGLYIDVFLNGIKLRAGEDYNTDTANTVAGISAMNSNDEVEVIAYDAFTVADTVSAADGGTFSGNVAMSGNNTISGNLSVTGTTSLTGAVTSSGLITASSGIKIANDGNIGSVGDADSMAISSGGVVTFSQIPANASNPAFRVYRSADQTGISDASITKVQFDAEEFDVGGYYDNSTNYRYTPLIAGYYFFVSVIQVSGTGIDQITNNLQKNGTAISWNTIMNSDSGAGYSGSSVMNSSLLFMNGSTDYVESHIFADVSSGTVTVEGVNPYRSHFEGFLVNRTA
tara:strand:- start:487 stop:1461 length:975 start_codon:yes stop_codon:yes gene_type:complete